MCTIDSQSNSIIIVGLTGSIGSGKSQAAAFFKELGAEIIDADLLAREIVKPNTPGLNEIKAVFGDQFITTSGELDRRALGQYIFTHPAERKKLEEITHPKVRRLFLERLDAVKQNPPAGTTLVVYVVPLLFESSYDYKELDKIIVVSAPKELALQRIIARDNCIPEIAAAKYNSQLPLEEKEKRADIVIRNDGDLNKLREEVKKVYGKLIGN